MPPRAPVPPRPFLPEHTRGLLGLCLLACLVAACSSLPMVDVPSQNQNRRINLLVFHFTSESFGESLRLLTERSERPVSAHYLVPEPGDATYALGDLKIHRLVPEHRRAWHAGRSHWGPRRSLNDSSIGIEIVNRSRCESSDPGAEIQTPEMQSCTFLDFPEEQIELVIQLTQGILARHTDIDPIDIVAHSDIAPTRRLDPGPKFPWQRLYENGIGAWYDEETVLKYRSRFEQTPPSNELIRQALQAYGYHLGAPNDEVEMRFVVRTFQMHFRPSVFDGNVDAETAAILLALLEKYRPRSLAALLEKTP